MNHTISAFGFFVCFAGQASGSPLVDRCHTNEKEKPFRKGGGFLIRAPFTGHRPTVGLVIGRWRRAPIEPAAVNVATVTAPTAECATPFHSKYNLTSQGDLIMAAVELYYKTNAARPIAIRVHPVVRHELKRDSRFEFSVSCRREFFYGFELIEDVKEHEYSLRGEKQ